MNPDMNFTLPPPVSQAAPDGMPGQATTPASQAIPTDGGSVAALQAAALQDTQNSATGQTTAVDEATLDDQYVQAAHKIAEATRNDPFEQNRKLASLRTEYLQKRYGKVVKLAD